MGISNSWYFEEYNHYVLGAVGEGWWHCAEEEYQ